MRPVALELEGFAAFRERTLVDFTDADLFAIVGATGHGKSTLIDAICFALYGSVPRHGERDIAPVISLGAVETKVSFTFELGGHAYIATRVLRRKPAGDGAQTRGLRLERQHADGTTEILAGKKDEFEAEIQRLVGLDFDQFTKCVVLPQGQFAAFLHARNAERVAILSALLDLGRYERMGQAARGRAREAEVRRGVLAAERERIGAATPAALAAARLRCEALGALHADIETAAPRDTDLAAELGRARTEADAARTAAGALRAIRVPDTVRELGRKHNDARREADAAEGGAATAEEAAGALEVERDALPAIEALVAAGEAHTKRAELVTRIEKGEAFVIAATATAAAASEARVASDIARAKAQNAVDDAQHRHAHAELRNQLVAGEPCPVCEQPVAELPPKLRSTELTKARRELTAAKTAYEKADAYVRPAEGELTKAQTLLSSLQEQLVEQDALISVHPDAAALAEQIRAVHAARENAAAARKAATVARTRAQKHAQALAASESALRKNERAMHDQRDALVVAGLTPPSSEGSVAEQWDDLASWATEALPDHEKRAAELDDLTRARTAERDAFIGEIATRAADLDIDVRTATSVAAMLPPVVGARSDSENAVTRVEEQLARAKELDAEITATRDDEVVAAELGRLLDRAHFGQWLVDEALGALVDGASALLERLSGGQYALRTNRDGDLLVVDHVNADETRSVRSLSGGETFQASLALALALADRIADLAVDGAAALESIFLDEGFGTLDPETLDVVAGTIETLGHGERVVGVVTHVADLAERMPVRFRVRKEGRTSVVTREET